MEHARQKAGLTRLPILAAVFVALVCVAILGLSAWQEWSARQARLKDAELEMASVARSTLQYADDSLDLIDTGIVGVAARLQIDGTNPTTISKLQQLMAKRKASMARIHGLAIIDEHEDWLTSIGGLTSQLSNDVFFRHHQQSPDPKPFVGPPIENLADGEWIVTISRRFNHPDGSFAGVVVGSISSSHLSQFYRQFQVGRHGFIALLHADGRLIARSHDSARYAGRDLSNRPLFSDPSLQTASGVYHFTSALDGTQRVSFFKRGDRFPLVLLATVEKDELLAPWRHAAIARIAVMLALVVLIAVIGVFLVRQLVRSRQFARVLASKEASFRLLAEGSSDLVTRIELDDVISYASPSSERILGLGPDQLVGTSILAGINPADLPRVRQTMERLKRGEIEEARTTARRRHGEKGDIWIESTLRVTRKADGAIDGAIAISRDVTEQKSLEEKLEALAIEDGLTGLANRRRFDERLADEWARAYRERSSIALLIVDLDHFKAYNDAYGHPAGDQCLRAIARILADEAQRAGDLAARYGGEEFALLLPNTDAMGCARIGQRVRRALGEAAIPHALNLPSNVVTASLGGAVCRPGRERSADPNGLIEAADRALYAAKEAGRDRLIMSGPVMAVLPVAAGE